MLVSSRLDIITQLITEQKFITVEELSQEFNVSGETIRRDLKILESRGILKRIYGGAFVEDTKESDISIQARKDKLVDSKQAMALLCKDLIEVNDTIFFDSSTTALDIAKQIDDIPMTIITNSLVIINHFSSFKNIRLISLGGTLDPSNMCFTGKTALNTLETYYAKKSFISCRCVSKDHGVMGSDEQITEVRTLALKNCQQNHLIIDHNKFNQTALCKIGDFSQFKAIITDQKPDLEWLDFFESHNIKIFYPE